MARISILSPGLGRPLVRFLPMRLILLGGVSPMGSLYWGRDAHGIDGGEAETIFPDLRAYYKGNLIRKSLISMYRNVHIRPSYRYCG